MKRRTFIAAAASLALDPPVQAKAPPLFVRGCVQAAPDGAWVPISEYCAAPPSAALLRGEIGRIACGVRFIGMDVAPQPDRTLHWLPTPDGGRIVFVHSRVVDEELRGC